MLESGPVKPALWPWHPAHASPAGLERFVSKNRFLPSCSVFERAQAVPSRRATRTSVDRNKRVSFSVHDLIVILPTCCVVCRRQVLQSLPSFHVRRQIGRASCRERV